MMKKLLKEVSQLPEDQRLVLANKLLSVSGVVSQEEVAAAWDSEICARISGYDSGALSSRSSSDVFSELDRQLQ